METNQDTKQRSIAAIEARPLKTFLGYEVPIWIGRCIDWLTTREDGGSGSLYDIIMAERKFLVGEEHTKGELYQARIDLHILQELLWTFGYTPNAFRLGGTHFRREKLPVPGDNGSNPARFTHTFNRYRFDVLALPEPVVSAGLVGDYQLWIDGLEVADAGNDVPRFDVLARIHYEKVQETLANGINGRDPREVYEIESRLHKTAAQLTRTPLDIFNILLAGGGERKRIGLEFTRYLYGAEVALVWFPDKRKQRLGTVSGTVRSESLGEVEESAAIIRFSRIMMLKGSTKAREDERIRNS